MAALLLPYTVLPQEGAPGPIKKRLVKLTIEVTDRDDKAPVENALVYVKSKGEDFEKSLDTNPRGIAKFTDVPLGKVRIQVIGRGRKTWGDDFELKQETQRITVSLEKKEKE
jgi:hypothetical protein